MRILFVVGLIALVIAVFSPGDLEAESYRFMGGGTTGDNSTDTTFAQVGSIPGRTAALWIKTGDAECHFNITDYDDRETHFVIQADKDFQKIPISAKTVEVDKTTIQRVTVLFLGN